MLLGAALVSAGLCSYGIRLPSVTRRSFSASGQMARKCLPGTHEWYTVACVCQVDRWGGPSAMVFAATSVDHCSDLVFIDDNLNTVCYRDEILGPVVLPFME